MGPASYENKIMWTRRYCTFGDKRIGNNKNSSKPVPDTRATEEKHRVYSIYITGKRRVHG